MHISEAHRQEFERQGMAIIPDALPADVAEQARGQFVAADYELIDQVREHHYEHVFKTDSRYLPQPGEHYLARFRRARALEAGPFLRPFYERHIKPFLDSLAGLTSTTVDLRAYQMVAGDHQRVHIDEYAGPVGFI